MSLKNLEISLLMRANPAIRKGVHLWLCAFNRHTSTMSYLPPLGIEQFKRQEDGWMLPPPTFELGSDSITPFFSSLHDGMDDVKHHVPLELRNSHEVQALKDHIKSLKEIIAGMQNGPTLAMTPVLREKFKRGNEELCK